MAMFFGSVKGQRGAATRLGGKQSGITTRTASTEGAIRTTAYFRGASNNIWVRIEMEPWNGTGQYALIYHGPIGKYDEDVFTRKVQEQVA